MVDGPWPSVRIEGYLDVHSVEFMVHHTGFKVQDYWLKAAYNHRGSLLMMCEKVNSIMANKTKIIRPK